MGRNPATGEPIKIPAKTVVKMRVAKAAKEAIVPERNRVRRKIGWRYYGSRERADYSGYQA